MHLHAVKELVDFGVRCGDGYLAGNHDELAGRIDVAYENRPSRLCDRGRAGVLCFSPNYFKTNDRIVAKVYPQLILCLVERS